MSETNRSRCLSHPIILLGQVSDVLSVSHEGSLTGFSIRKFVYSYKFIIRFPFS